MDSESSQHIGFARVQRICAYFTRPRRFLLSFPVQTIVIGHRNPDMDSVCSALAYARLKQALGWNDVVAGAGGQPQRAHPVRAR